MKPPIGHAIVIRGDARGLPLPDASVDLITTSPPYFGLRDYRDNGGSLGEQIGSESTPAEYLANLWACTREWMRILKPKGSLFVNLGDSYYSGKGAPGRTTTDAKSAARTARRLGGNPLDGPSFGVRQKSLVGLPWLYALGCTGALAALGGPDPGLNLILRAEVIWNKPNGLPESVTDRVRRSHEQWFHMTLQPRYYSAVDEIREPHTSGTHGATRGARTDKRADAESRYRHPNTDYRTDRDHDALNPLGKLPGSVWEIASEPLKVPAELDVDHFAAFPSALPARIIAGWSPPGICTACGEGRRPIVRRGEIDPDLLDRRGGHSKASLAYSLAVHTPRGDQTKRGIGLNISGPERAKHRTPDAISGYACACPEPTAPTRPAVVLDPFSGTGTTPMVAKALGRIGVGVDRSLDYCRLAMWRTNDAKQIAQVRGERRPVRQVIGQEALDFGGLTA